MEIEVGTATTTTIKKDTTSSPINYSNINNILPKTMKISTPDTGYADANRRIMQDNDNNNSRVEKNIINNQVEKTSINNDQASNRRSDKYEKDAKDALGLSKENDDGAVVDRRLVV